MKWPDADVWSNKSKQEKRGTVTPKVERSQWVSALRRADVKPLGGRKVSRLVRNCRIGITAQTSSEDGTHQHPRNRESVPLRVMSFGVAIIAVETVYLTASPKPHPKWANHKSPLSESE